MGTVDAVVAILKCVGKPKIDCCCESFCVCSQEKGGKKPKWKRKLINNNTNTNANSTTAVKNKNNNIEKWQPPAEKVEKTRR